MTQKTIDWTSQQQATRDAMSTASLGPGITSRNELDGMTGRDVRLGRMEASTDARSRPLGLTNRGMRRQEEGWTQCESAALALRAILGKERIAALHVLAEGVHRLLDRHAGPRRPRERRGTPATGILSVRTA